LTISIASIVGLTALGTFIKVICEYRLQGRQKRAQLFNKFKEVLLTDYRMVSITDLLEDNHPNLEIIPLMNKYYFLGFYEQIAISVNSKLLNKNIAYYMFGYFALRCWESNNFWAEINRDSYYWSLFKRFVDTMQKIENRNLHSPKLWYKKMERMARY